MVFWITGKELDKFRHNGSIVDDSVCIDRDSWLDMNAKVVVGKGCIISTGSLILGHDGAPQVAGLRGIEKVTTLGENVFVGAHSVILCGVTIGNNVIIGAGSVVTKDVPSNQVWAGNPARFIKTIEQYKADLITIS